MTVQASTIQRRDAAGLLVLYLVATAYNLAKPFHIDDAAHLMIAQWIVGHPLHPMSGQINWGGTSALIATTNQPHLLFYLYAEWGRIFGFGEIPMHLLQSIFTLAAILSFYRLAQATGLARPLWATALLALNPAFLVEQNLMVDVPLLALWLAFFGALIGMRHSPRQRARFAIAATACAAALLVKYSSLVLLPILAGAMVWERRWSKLWLLAIPLLALGGWSLFNWLDYGAVHILQRSPEHRDTARKFKMLLAWLFVFGSLTPVAIAVALRWSLRRNWQTAAGILLLLLPFLIVAGVAAGWLPDRDANLGLRAFAAANGLLVFTLAGLSGWMLFRNRDGQAQAGIDRAIVLYLAAWILVTSVFYILLSPFIAARHGLLIMPPLILLLARWRQQSANGWLDVLALVATAALSLGLGIADFRFADFYKSGVAQIAQEAPPAPHRYVSGHWGLQYYAGRAGFSEIDVDRTRLVSGDLLLRSDQVFGERIEHLPPLRLVAVVTETHPMLELFCTGAPSHFYSSSAHDLPWSANRNCAHRLDLYQVR